MHPIFTTTGTIGLTQIYILIIHVRVSKVTCTCTCNISQIFLTIKALHPLLVLATRQPSVVAIEMWYSFTFKRRGSATPTGNGM